MSPEVAQSEMGRRIVVFIEHDPLHMRTRVWYATGATRWRDMRCDDRSDERWTEDAAS